MKFPDKVTPYKQSVIAKFPIVLEKLQKENMTPATLYKKVKRHIDNTSEFTNILTCLYALNKIDFIDEEVLYHVENHPVRQVY
ncbi:MAG: hypothetical protein FWG67_08540 [Defluviitaleaceae bacterium]|nr:hypothetical protein [Defluviitaleaceae bacterium]